MKYYCNECKDKLCTKCIDFPWDCPEIKRCGNCDKEMRILEELYLRYIKGDIELKDIETTT